MCLDWIPPSFCDWIWGRRCMPTSPVESFRRRAKGFSTKKFKSAFLMLIFFSLVSFHWRSVWACRTWSRSGASPSHSLATSLKGCIAAIAPSRTTTDDPKCISVSPLVKSWKTYSLQWNWMNCDLSCWKNSSRWLTMNLLKAIAQSTGWISDHTHTPKRHCPLRLAPPYCRWPMSKLMAGKKNLCPALAGRLGWDRCCFHPKV